METTAEMLRKTRDQAHPRCVVCNPNRDGGLRLDFAPTADGGVEALFHADARWEGYPGFVQGGIVSSLLDGAMTNGLFARGTVNVTAEMTVRFLEPLLLDEDAVVSAHVERDRPPLRIVNAEVRQGGRVKATARGKFLPHPDNV